jgi:hypothetical protein
MFKRGTQTRTAQIGLEEIPSSTRATRGLGRGGPDSPPKREEHRSVLEIFGDRGVVSRAAPPSSRPLIEASSGEEDDDLDIWSRIKPVLPNGKPNSLETEQDLIRKTRVRAKQPSINFTRITYFLNFRFSDISTFNAGFCPLLSWYPRTLN